MYQKKKKETTQVVQAVFATYDKCLACISNVLDRNFGVGSNGVLVSCMPSDKVVFFTSTFVFGN